MVGKSAEMGLLVGARIKSCYNGRKAGVLLLVAGRGAVWNEKKKNVRLMNALISDKAAAVTSSWKCLLSS